MLFMIGETKSPIVGNERQQWHSQVGFALLALYFINVCSRQNMTSCDKPVLYVWFYMSLFWYFTANISQVFVSGRPSYVISHIFGWLWTKKILDNIFLHFQNMLIWTSSFKIKIKNNFDFDMSQMKSF